METVAVAERSSGASCYECGMFLVKQTLKDSGEILTRDEIVNLKLLEEMYEHTLECDLCGGLCYEGKRKYKCPSSGVGLCKKCVGSHVVNRPRWFMSRAEELRWGWLRNLTKIWSCPIHGSLPIKNIDHWGDDVDPSFNIEANIKTYNESVFF